MPAAPAAPRREPAPPREPVWRPRVNQPTGFVMATHLRPTFYYGRRHSYAYYPRDWVDKDTGVSYQSGYYDEEGRRYDNVTFEEDGRYKNVVCHCPYCEQDTILDLSASDVESHSLTCKNCGAPMEIVSELDSIILNASDGSTPNTHVYNSEESLKNAFPQKKKKRRVWPIILGVLLLLFMVGRIGERSAEPEPSGGQLQQISLVENGGHSQNAVYLERQADGSYHVVNDVVRADLILYYDRDEDCYYDEASGVWLWYNTEVEPPAWQYWVEGVSSDYGDYGWLEHDEAGWFIEVDEGRWVPVPDSYDMSDLWYIG